MNRVNLEILHHPKQDKVYIVEILEDEGMLHVYAHYGRRLQEVLTRRHRMKTEHVEFAETMFEAIIAGKVKDGYNFPENGDNLDVPALVDIFAATQPKPKKKEIIHQQGTVEEYRRL
jgi:hypothetical protein